MPRNLCSGWHQPNLAAHIYAYGEKVSVSASCLVRDTQHKKKSTTDPRVYYTVGTDLWRVCNELSRISRLYTIIYTLEKKIEKI